MAETDPTRPGDGTTAPPQTPPKRPRQVLGGIYPGAKQAIKLCVAASVIAIAAITGSYHYGGGSDKPLMYIGWIALVIAIIAALVFAYRSGPQFAPAAAAPPTSVAPPASPVAMSGPVAASTVALPSTAHQADIRAAADAQTDAMIRFAQRLIQTPSLSGQEQDVAQLVANEMRSLGYDEVKTDLVGNVIGLYRGTANGPSVQFNSHIDHVAPGDPNLWSRPPYGGDIEDGVLYGRAASDVKGALATQVYLVPVLRAAGLRPAGDVYVVGAVLEEVGGLGSHYLADQVPTTYAVLGEATNNQLRRGHRGRVGIQVTFTGHSVHASAPERGVNPQFAVARFLLKLESLPMTADPTFGSSTVTPTLVKTDQTSPNVTPGTVTISLDWRTVPAETPEAIAAKLEPLLRQVEQEVPGITATMEIVGRPVTTYTGISEVMPPTRGYETPAADPLVQTARASLQSSLGRPVEIGTWTFATDGGHLSAAGIKTIGFAPSEERFAHTIDDQVSLAQLHEALIGNAALALDLTSIGQ